MFPLILSTAHALSLRGSFPGALRQSQIFRLLNVQQLFRNRIRSPKFAPQGQRHLSRVTVVLSVTLLTTIVSLLGTSVVNARAEHGFTEQHLRQWQPVDSMPPSSHASKAVVSPDNRFVAVTIVPLGTETAFLARTQLYEIESAELRYTVSGYLPHWQIEAGTGSLLLALMQHNRAAVVYRVGDTLEELPGAEAELLADPRHLQAELAAMAQLSSALASDELAYPATIRVAHHPSNGCRDVAEWQVDVIPFEEYVARVVPAENPASWPIDALAAQAVAARTYAWRQILMKRPDYDVTDWANFQMMCDDRYPNSDQAVAMTAGQYLATLDDPAAYPISAMYSAENGHPTLTNTNVTYLKSVPDRYGLGRTRWGHGYGLSQWGAARRAWAGQNYRQILGHYYSSVYLVSGPNRSTPIGAILDTITGDTLTGAAITLRAMTPPHALPHFTIDASQGLTTTITVDGNGHTWFPPVSFEQGTILTATLWGDGQPLDQQQWQIMRQTPLALSEQAATALPKMIDQREITITLPSATDQPLLSAPQLQWEGEALSHMYNSGSTVADPLAFNGIAWAAMPAQHSSGVWYGPYTQALRAGRSYRALFWLRTVLPNDSVSTAPAISIGTLDVTDDEGRVPLGLRHLRFGDFVNGDRYTPVAVDFHLFHTPVGLEFRVAWAGETALWFDRVEIWQLPDQLTQSANAGDGVTSGHTTFRWDSSALMPPTGFSTPLSTRLQIRYMDQAANLSESYEHDVTIVDLEPPSFELLSLPSDWISGAQIAQTGLTLTVPLTDTFSGLDRERALITIIPTIGTMDGAGTEVPATIAENRAAQGVVATATLTKSLIPSDTSAIYTVTLAAYDLAGNRASTSGVLSVDALAPSITMSIRSEFVTTTLGITEGAYSSHANVSPSLLDIPASSLPADVATTFVQATNWYTAPITVTTLATDDASGVEMITATVAAVRAAGDVTTIASDMTHSHSLTVAITNGGLYLVSAWAEDRAGNLSTTHTQTVALDLEPPTVILMQQPVNSETVHLRWESFDDGSGVEQVVVQVRRDGNAWAEIGTGRLQPVAGIDIPLLTEHATTVRARARDRVGQWGEWVEMELWHVRDRIYLPLISR